MASYGSRSPIRAKAFPRNTTREFLRSSSRFLTVDRKEQAWDCISPGKLSGVTEGKSAWRAKRGRGAFFGLRSRLKRKTMQVVKCDERASRPNLEFTLLTVHSQ